MAKRDGKKKDKKDAQQDAADMIRSGIERAIALSAEGAQATRERTREVVDEITAAAGRVRQSLEDMRVLDEVKRLRTEVEALASRVASLEAPGRRSASKPAASKPAATKTTTRSRAKSTSSRSRKTTARKSTARKSTARKSTAAKKPAARRSTAKKSTARRSAAKKPAAAKPAAAKPAASKDTGSS
jgi:hypothetical protein